MLAKPHEHAPRTDVAQPDLSSAAGDILRDQKGERRSPEHLYLSRHARKASRARSPDRRGSARSVLSRRRYSSGSKGRATQSRVSLSVAACSQSLTSTLPGQTWLSQICPQPQALCFGIKRASDAVVSPLKKNTKIRASAMEPMTGFEPVTYSLRMSCSTS
jgi:hypothetical protein